MEAGILDGARGSHMRKAMEYEGDKQDALSSSFVYMFFRIGDDSEFAVIEDSNQTFAVRSRER